MATNNNKSAKAISVVIAIMITTITIASFGQYSNNNSSSALLPTASAQKPDNLFGTI